MLPKRKGGHRHGTLTFPAVEAQTLIVDSGPGDPELTSDVGIGMAGRKHLPHGVDFFVR